MTYSEDHASPPAPFSGDGSVFDHPDVLLQSPTTNERVVDTQSGFLVVVRRMGERLALSCKRRVGTPPSSNILLTPDESVKLSKILAASIIGLDEPTDQNAGNPALGGRRRFPFTTPTPKRGGVMQKFGAPAAVIGVVALVGGFFIAGLGVGRATTPAAAPVKVDVLETASVDKFARMFVSDMLDFNPDTYKVSQVQAMSYMTPELLDKYWKETNFPLSRRQLKSLPQGSTVMITKIGQERTAPEYSTADIYAELVRAESKVSNPVHIKLKLGVGPENHIQVIEQEDLTSAVMKESE